MPGETSVEVEGLRKTYGSLVAVDDVSFAVRRGEVFGLLGPNGAGKTTTVEILEGYRRRDAGRVSVLGLDPGADGRRLRPRIGVMLQEGGLYPGIKVAEALHLFASYYEDPDDPERLLEAVGLGEARGTVVRRLSGGQRQRLSLALALVGRPEIAFLDEPTAGMDPHARADAWSMVRDLRGRGAAVVLTTHSMEEAEALGDRLAIVDGGRLVALGTPAELTASAPSAETRFSAAPGLDLSSLSAALGLSPHRIVETRPGEYVLSVAADAGLVADLAAWLRDRGVVLGDLRATRRSLEEVFLRLTGAADEAPAREGS